jgi:hypothetical protein
MKTDFNKSYRHENVITPPLLSYMSFLLAKVKVLDVYILLSPKLFGALRENHGKITSVRSRCFVTTFILWTKIITDL